MGRAAVGAAVLASVAALTACSPVIVSMRVVGGGQGVQVEATQGPDDGFGSIFNAAAVCSGEGWWKTGNWTNVNNAPNIGPTASASGNHWAAIVWCGPTQAVVAANYGRGPS